MKVRNLILFQLFLVSTLLLMQGIGLADTQEEALQKLASKNIDDPGVRTEAIFVAFDFDKNDNLNEDEFARVVIKLYAELDSNQNQTLEENELVRGWTPEINQIDANQNHIIEFSEVIKHIDASFKERDANGDAQLSKEEVETFMKKQAEGGRS